MGMSLTGRWIGRARCYVRRLGGISIPAIFGLSSAVLLLWGRRRVSYRLAVAVGLWGCVLEKEAVLLLGAISRRQVREGIVRGQG